MDAYVSHAINHQLPLLVALAALMGLGKGGVPGFATIATAATVLTAPPGGLGYAVSLQVPILTLIDIYAAWLHSDKLDWTTVWTLLPLSFVGMAFGQWVDSRTSDAMARVVVGSILLCILVLRTWRPIVGTICPRSRLTVHPLKRKESDVDEDDLEMAGLVAKKNRVDQQPVQRRSKDKQVYSTFAWAAVVGLVGGAATMLTNSMGPILNVYLLSVRKLPPASYIGTRAMFFCFLNIGKLPMRFAAGTLGWPMLPLAAGLGLVSVVGVYCAKPIMMSMPERTFVALELAVVAFAGLRLCWMGLHS